MSAYRRHPLGLRTLLIWLVLATAVGGIASFNVFLHNRNLQRSNLIRDHEREIANLRAEIDILERENEAMTTRRKLEAFAETQPGLVPIAPGEATVLRKNVPKAITAR